MQKETYFQKKIFSSFPFISLEIFSRCLKKITKLKKRIEYCSQDSENKTAKKISKIFETIAASEEYLNIMKVINQHNKNVIAKKAEYFIKIPINTAIPLPPLNLSHTGKI